MSRGRGSFGIRVGLLAFGTLGLAGCRDPRVDELANRVGAMEGQMKTLTDCCEDGGPGRGPIIVLEPTTGGSGSLTTAWKLDGVAVTTWGNPGQLREDVFGTVELFGVTGASGGEKTAKWFKLQLTDATGYSHTLLIERTPTGQFAWTLDTLALVACDFASGNGVPDCKSGTSGLPPAFNGTITGATAEVLEADGSSGTIASGVKSMRVQAKQ